MVRRMTLWMFGYLLCTRESPRRHGEFAGKCSERIGKSSRDYPNLMSAQRLGEHTELNGLRKIN
jgi:hypothetical protein